MPQINGELFLIANDESAGSGVVVIGGAVGGVVVFLLLVMLCIVALLIRRSHRKYACSSDKKNVHIEPSIADITVSDAEYNTSVKPDNDYLQIIDPVVLLHTHDVVKMESNPLYGIITTSTNSDVIIQPNPSYGLNKSASVESEDQYGYVQPNEYKPPVHHHTEQDTVKMEDNSSLTSRDEKAVSQGLDDT